MTSKRERRLMSQRFAGPLAGYHCETCDADVGKTATIPRRIGQ